MVGVPAKCFGRSVFAYNITIDIALMESDWKYPRSLEAEIRKQ